MGKATIADREEELATRPFPAAGDDALKELVGLPVLASLGSHRTVDQRLVRVQPFFQAIHSRALAREVEAWADEVSTRIGLARKIEFLRTQDKFGKGRDGRTEFHVI